MNSRALLASFFLGVTLLPAQMLQSWQALEVPFFSHGKLTSNVQLQFRSQDSMKDFMQGRIGPQLRYALSERLTLLGGYYLTEIDGDNGEPWANTHRLFTGAESPIRAGKGRMNFRGLLERYFGGDGTPEFRYRGQASYRRSVGAFAPGFSTESFFNAVGYMSQRAQASLRLPAVGRVQVDLSYIYDFRPEKYGGKRQVIYTTIRVRGGER